MSALVQRVLDTDYRPLLADLESNTRNTAKEVITNTQAVLSNVHTEQQARNSAERFVFTEDAPGSIMQRVNSKELDYKLMLRTLRLPAHRMWIEWKIKYDDGSTQKLGALLLSGTSTVNRTFLMSKSPLDRSDEILVNFWVEDEMGACPYMFATMPMLPFDFEIAPAKLRWAINKGRVGDGGIRYDEKRAESEIRGMFRDLFCCLFLLVTPKTCDYRETEHSAKLQRSRIKRGKAPFIEYRQVTVKIGVPTPRYKSQGITGDHVPDESGRHYKYHNVIGHFNTYHTGKDRKGVKIHWIPEMWRGDPSLGIIMRERKVVDGTTQAD